MDITLETLEQSRVKLLIEADANKLEEGLAHAFRKLNRKVTIPGFRKGKAPRNIFERHFGQEALYEDALDYLLPRLYQEALIQKELHPVDQPDIKVNKIEPAEGLSFEAQVDVYPQVELGEYLGLAIEKNIKTVTDEDVDKELDNLRQKHGQLGVVDSRDEVENGDFAIIDFKGYLEGEPFPGGAATGHTLEIGSGNFIPGFEEQLIGMKKGEEKDINVTFPEDYHSQDLAGKEVVFSVTVNDLKERVLPELDDEFAKDCQFDTLTELKEDIRVKLEKAIAESTKEEMENKLIEQIIENSTIPLPDSMVEQQIDHQLNNLKTNLMYSGMDLETYLHYTNKTEEEFRNDMIPGATTQVKRGLILEEIASKEGISASETEIGERIQELATDYPDPDKGVEMLQSRKDEIANMLKIEKTWELLFENANITEVPEENSGETKE